MKALVTGGGGFLGGRIVRMLCDRGDEPVALGRRAYPELDALGIKTVRADIRDRDAVDHACTGVDVVFHTAALTGIWGRRSDFHSINVEGTKNVIEACRRAGVPRLVFTSSPSVVFGASPLCGVDESQPYPKRHLADYPATKAAAERLVLAANHGGLSTVALRPHLIWGPGDPHLIPRVLERARAGKLKQIGDGTNLVDITYIDNAAEAHLLAAEALVCTRRCAGKPYFISQGVPVALWSWINQLLRRVGIPPVTRRVPFSAALAAGGALEFVFRTARLGGEPPLTRFVAFQLHKSHYFNISAARHDLGFTPRVSTNEGMDRLQEWLVDRAYT